MAEQQIPVPRPQERGAQAPAAEQHEHRWQNGPTTRQSRCEPSPMSEFDDHLYDEVVLTQTCECGATRRLAIGFENRRRRGDDHRRAIGKAPLGQPLQASGTYRNPRVLR
jgi:hypothetical protein